MHPDLIAALACQHNAALADDAEQRRRAGPRPRRRRPPIKATVGAALVRWGTRWSPPPVAASATMSS